MINRTYIKLYPAEYHSQSAIDASLTLRPQIGSDPEAIEKVTIETFTAAVEIIGGEPEKWRPTTRETADHSLPYCVAVALMDGKITLESFDDAHLGNKELLDLVQKIEVKASEALNAKYPEGIPNLVRVHLRDGRVFENEVTFPKGHARNPMTDDEVVVKFRTLAEPVLAETKISEILDRCWNLDKQSEVASLLALCAVERNHASSAVPNESG
jgi:2-methylcitrate dehydratase